MSIYNIDPRHRVEIDLSKISPWLKYDLCMLLNGCAKQGLFLIITSGYRSFSEQNALYTHGRTKKGQIETNARGGYSQHNFGDAFDIAINDKKHTWDVAYFKKVYKIAKKLKLPLGWGGNWKSFKDYPHFYLTEFGDTARVLREKYGTYENYKKTWTCTVKCTTQLRVKSSFKSKTMRVVKSGQKFNVLWKSPKGYAKVELDGNVGFIHTCNIA